LVLQSSSHVQHSCSSDNQSLGDYLVIGRFGSVYGIRGWIKVHSFTTPSENILQYQPWKIYLSHSWQNLSIKETRFSSHQSIVQIEGCLTPEAARRYVGAEIGTSPDRLPTLPVGEYYWSQLIGLHVVTTNGVELGIVDHLFETGSNDVLVIQGERTRMLPYLPNRVIQSIDLSLQKIVVDWDPEF
jgi:16S rRNA processing protein RimM